MAKRGAAAAVLFAGQILIARPNEFPPSLVFAVFRASDRPKTKVLGESPGKERTNMDNRGRGPEQNRNQGAPNQHTSTRRPAAGQAGSQQPARRRPVRSAPTSTNRPTGTSGTGPVHAQNRPRPAQGAKTTGRRPKKHRTMGAVIRNIFVVALLSVLIVYFVLYLAGFRYMSYKVVRAEETVSVKYVGRVNSSGDPTGGLVIYANMTARVRASDNTIAYSNGDVYKGEMKKMLKHGQGKMVFDNGDVYEGTFVNDVISGEGTFTYKSGDVYTGSFAYGQRSGQGTMTFADGTTYTGGFSDNLRSGTGKQVYADGTVYEGDFSNDMKNGTGTITYANGDTYTGDFVNDKRSGSGTYTWSNGESYTGEFSDDQLSGTGTYKWPSGRTYTGKFSNGTIVLDEA